MIRQDAQILGIGGDLRDHGADRAEHLGVLALQEADRELQAADEGAHHLRRVLGVTDAGYQGETGVTFDHVARMLQQGPDQSHAVQPVLRIVDDVHASLVDGAFFQHQRHVLE